MTNRIKRFFSATILAAAFTAAISIHTAPAHADEFTPARKLQATEQMIRMLYVDSVPEEKMVDNAIIAMLKTLDPHSSYTDASETRQVTEPLQGNFSGIGIQFKMLNDTLFVVQTIASGPSEKVGILAGDRIIAVNDSAIAGVKMVNTDIMKRLRGRKGTKVDLRVVRRGVAEPINFRVVRDDIPLYSVDAFYCPAPGTAYIKISRFAESTAKEVREALADLEKQHPIESVVIDLQDNGGGYLQSAIELADMFLPAGSPVVYTEGMRQKNASYETSRKGKYADCKLIVLVNQYSASASEIFAGAVQDNDRGLVIGRRTFGKGLVQRPIPFPDGSMIRLTVARYHTPSGRCIQKPYALGESEEYQLDMLNRYESGELFDADSIHFSDSLRYTTLRLGRTVYGGGGIMPDRFVAVDTTQMNAFMRDVIAKGVPAMFATRYSDANRKTILRNYPTIESFAERFEFSPALMDEFLTMAASEGVERRPEQEQAAADYLATVLKGLIANDLYDRGAYYHIVNPLNPVYSEAMHALSEGFSL